MNEGSFPKEFYLESMEEPDSDSAGAMTSEAKPRILLMGMRRSGKSSIQKVVFYKMAPNDTLFLESTNQISKDDIANTSFIQFQIWDFPGQIELCEYDLELIFGSYGALIFVVDAQDEYAEALKMLRKTLTNAYKINTGLNFEVFIHKVDGLAEDQKMEIHRDILQSVSDDLIEEGLEELRITYHLTSIYDHSIYEAFSKVVQKLIPQLPTLENLLDIFIANSGIEKVFLFDVISKIYIATDSSPVEMQSYELCCDMIDVVLDVSCIYGSTLQTLTTTSNISGLLAFGGFVQSPATVSSNGFLVHYCVVNGSENVEEDNSGFDAESSSTIKLNNQTILYLREVNRHLAMVCILRAESFERRGLIDYNFMCLRRAIKEVFSVSKRSGEQTTSEQSYAATSDVVPVVAASK